MKAIVCVDKNWGIGSQGDLLFHIPADLRFFKEKTIGNVVVMGQATFFSLPGQDRKQEWNERNRPCVSNKNTFFPFP